MSHKHYRPSGFAGSVVWKLVSGVQIVEGWQVFFFLGNLSWGRDVVWRLVGWLVSTELQKFFFWKGTVGGGESDMSGEGNLVGKKAGAMMLVQPSVHFT